MSRPRLKHRVLKTHPIAFGRKRSFVSWTGSGAEGPTEARTFAKVGSFASHLPQPSHCMGVQNRLKGTFLRHDHPKGRDNFRRVAKKPDVPQLG